MFCGTAVATASAAQGHYYAGPGNKFWWLLHQSGLTPTQLRPADDSRLPDFGLGLTDLSDAVQSHDRGLRYDVPAFVEKVAERSPSWVAFTSRTAAQQVARSLGRQKPALGEQQWALGPIRVFVLPSPSGSSADPRHWAPKVSKLAWWSELTALAGRGPLT